MIRNRQEIDFLAGMEQYINRLTTLPATQAEAEARAALIRSGCINEDGTPKDSIVTREL